MKLTNYVLGDINYTLNQLADEKIKGAFKFKLFTNKQKLEDKIVVLQQSLEGVEDPEERHEIMSVEQEVSLEVFTMEELEELPLSLRQLTALKPIIKFEEEK